MQPASGISYRPPNEPQIFYDSHKYGMVGVQIALVLYGIATTLFLQCFRSYIRLLRPTPRSLSGIISAFKSAGFSTKLQLAFVTALFICGTLNVVGLAIASTVVALDYPLYPGGPFLWTLTHNNQPIPLLAQVSFMVTTWLAEGFMLYRCSVIYTATTGVWFVLLLPGSLYLAQIGIGAALTFYTTQALNSVWNLIHFTIANAAISASLNVLITALISIRLVLHGVSMHRAMGTRNGNSTPRSIRTYTSVWTILVESSALYALASLLFIVTLAVDHPIAKMFLPILAQVQVVAPLLVSIRLSKQMAWTRTTSKAAATGAISSIHFNAPEDAAHRSPARDMETDMSFASRGESELADTPSTLDVGPSGKMGKV